jgi:hypothetical protein
MIEGSKYWKSYRVPGTSYRFPDTGENSFLLPGPGYRGKQFCPVIKTGCRLSGTEQKQQPLVTGNR